MEFPLLQLIAHQVNKSLTFFDLETTTFLGRSNFGITEIAWLHVHSDRPIEKGSQLVCPGHAIPPEVIALTGITNEMVRGADPWNHTMLKVVEDWANHRLLLGFNSETFDVPALRSQHERYGAGAFPMVDHRDVRNYWRHISGKSKGKLTEVAEFFKIEVSTSHRAMADVETTARIMEKILEKHGVDFFFHPAGAMSGSKNVEKAFMGGSNPDARWTSKEDECLRAIESGIQTMPELVRRTGISEFELSRIVPDLVMEGKLAVSTMQNKEAQLYLQEEVPLHIEQAWSGSNRGKDKPIFQALVNPPKSVDYLQLRLYLIESGHRGAIEK